MPMRYYLDEDQPFKAAPICRARGLDVVATEERGRKGASDASQLELAASEGRVLVTRNRGDFERLTRQFMGAGLPHGGVLVVPRSLSQNNLAGLAEAILMYDREHPEGMPPYAIDYLVPVRRRTRRG